MGLEIDETMAITDIPEYAHLSESDIEALCVELDAIRADIEADRGERDARYLRNTIRFQRGLELAGRVLIAGSTRGHSGGPARRRSASPRSSRIWNSATT